MCRETRFNAMVKEMWRNHGFFCIYCILEEKEEEKKKRKKASI